MSTRKVVFLVDSKSVREPSPPFYNVPKNGGDLCVHMSGRVRSEYVELRKDSVSGIRCQVPYFSISERGQKVSGTFSSCRDKP